MFRCKFIQFLLSIIPLKIWQDFLIRSHVYKCDECKSQLASPDDVKALLYQESDVENFREIWPHIKEGISEKKMGRKAFFPFRLKWILATASFMSLIIAGILFYSIFIRNTGLTEQDQGGKFQINSIRVNNEPATPFLYQPQDSEMIIIWAEKSL